jgi:regulation of enolase protein 1 (concanavalin A-like superfamily)
MPVEEWSWLNEPAEWAGDERSLRLRTDPKTDFWRVTHYGFVRDSGHFAYREISGDFRVDVLVRGAYETLYDQAGLMLRIDERTWLKCGVELVDGVQQASAVVTRDYSDWSVVPLAANPPAIWLRLTRIGEAVEIHYSLDGEAYSLLRLAYLPPAETVQVGLMAASPEGDGFSATFEGFAVALPTPRQSMIDAGGSQR